MSLQCPADMMAFCWSCCWDADPVRVAFERALVCSMTREQHLTVSSRNAASGLISGRGESGDSGTNAWQRNMGSAENTEWGNC